MSRVLDCLQVVANGQAIYQQIALASADTRLPERPPEPCLISSKTLATAVVLATRIARTTALIITLRLPSHVPGCLPRGDAAWW